MPVPGTFDCHSPHIFDAPPQSGYNAVVDQTQPTRPKSQPKTLLFFAAFLCSFVLTGFGPPRLIDNDFAPTVRLDTAELSAMAEAGQAPPISAKAALMVDLDADQILFRLNENQPLPHASLTKLMTALLVLERSSADAAYLDAQVTVQASDLVGGATMGLQAGETLTVRQLLFGLLIPSGNDAAMALARHYTGSIDAGSVDTFVQQMNQRASTLGLTNTNFQNPHGFDADNHFSSAQDTLTIARQLLRNPLLREIIGTSSITVAGHPLKNTNQLLGSFGGAIGMKTGTTPAAGQCLVAMIERNGSTVLIVELGSRNRYSDARDLYAAYERNFRWTGGTPDRRTALDRLYDADGNTWYLTAQGDAPRRLRSRWAEAPLRKFRRIALSKEEPWSAGMQAGSLEWWQGDELIAEQPLVLE